MDIVARFQCEVFPFFDMLRSEGWENGMGEGLPRDIVAREDLTSGGETPGYRGTPADEWRDRLARPLAQLLLPFYRRYPYCGDCSLFHLNVRGAFSPLDMFFYNRIPKAANSTVSGVLARHSQFTRRFSDGGDKRRMLHPSQMTAAQVRALARGEVFRFTFVRNPYSRVLSAWQDKFLRDKPQRRRYAPMMECPPSEVPNFTQFCRFLDRGGLWRDAHWAPQTSLLLLPLSEFDFVGKIENFDRDMATVVARIWKIENPEPFDRRGPPRTDADTKIASVYTDEARAIVARLYAEDFSAFGYPV